MFDINDWRGTGAVKTGRIKFNNGMSDLENVTVLFWSDYILVTKEDGTATLYNNDIVECMIDVESIKNRARVG